MRGLQLQPHCTYQGKNPITSNDYNFRQPHCQSKKRQMIQPQHYNDQRKNKKMRARNLYMAKCPILLALVLVLVLPNTKKFTGGLASFLLFFFCLAAWWLKTVSVKEIDKHHSKWSKFIWYLTTLYDISQNHRITEIDFLPRFKNHESWIFVRKLVRKKPHIFLPLFGSKFASFQNFDFISWCFSFSFFL